jgi:membrane associated rhomboid family serine protease
MIPYKDDNPSGTVPVVTVALIAVNVAVFLFFRVQGGAVFQAAVFELCLIPRELWSGSLPGSESHFPWTGFLTSMFMHAGWLHLGGNMLYLWIFGDNVEDRLGHARFLVFYLVCGLIACFFHVLFNLGSRIPLVGASGAIAGVLGAYLFLFPQARVRVLIFFVVIATTVRVPAWLMLGLWFVLQVMNALPGRGAVEGGTAFLAHVGGFAAGFAYLWARRDRFSRRVPARFQTWGLK